MYIIVDDRDIVAGGYANGFDREGVSSAGIEAAEFREWIGKISDSDMNAVEAFLDSGAKRNTLKKSGFEHPFQARQSRLGMAS